MRLAQGFANAINGLCDGRWPVLLVPAAKGQGSEGCTGDIMWWGNNGDGWTGQNVNLARNGAIISHSRRNATRGGTLTFAQRPCDSAAGGPEMRANTTIYLDRTPST